MDLIIGFVDFLIIAFLICSGLWVVFWVVLGLSATPQRPAPEFKPTMLNFKTQKERDDYLTYYYPERLCTATPGLFNTKCGPISVHGLTITFY